MMSRSLFLRKRSHFGLERSPPTPETRQLLGLSRAAIQCGVNPPQFAAVGGVELRSGPRWYCQLYVMNIESSVEACAQPGAVFE
jgi:hypothetical protein